MTGFEVSFQDKVIRASIDSHNVVCAIISYLNKSVTPENSSTHLNVSGLVSFERMIWFSGKIDDVEKNSELQDSHPADREEMLERYHVLKKELEEEGLL
jgi:hypothetical protein